MTTKTSTNDLITCLACGEKKRPAVFRAVFCKECADQIEADMSLPLPPQPAVPAGFKRNDVRPF